MNKQEMLIDRIRELARGQDAVTYNTLIKAADLMENQRSNIMALQKCLEMAQGERDAVTKRMIQLEQELHDAKSELEAAVHGQETLQKELARLMEDK